MSTATLTTPTRVGAPLTLGDRCDRCGAQAFVRVKLPDSRRLTALRAELAADVESLPDPGELTFCGHHGREYEAGLAVSGATVQDETGKINEKPSVSANAR